MKSLSFKKIGILIFWGVSWMGGRDASAQGLAVGAGTGTASLGVPTSATGGLPAGMAAMAASTGVPSSASGAAAQGMFSNPLTAPLLYNSMLQSTQPQAAANNLYGPTGLATTQMGLLLLANQRARGGIGSGQISGSRGPTRSGEASANPATDPARRASSRPGGLAARYFNRAGARSPYPKSYFNRRPRYFP